MFYCLFFSKYTSSLLDFQVHFKCTLVPSVNRPNVHLERYCYQSQERDEMHRRKFFPASRPENGSFEVWHVTPNIFSFLPKLVALVFTVIFSKKQKQKQKRNKTFARANWTNRRTTVSMKIFWLFTQKPRLYLTQPIWSHFFQRYNKNAQNLS